MSVAAVATVAVTGASGGGAVATAAKPTLAVVVVGSGRVTSKPAGIFCPGKCSATFAAGSSVLLTSKAKAGSRFLRWGGNCTGTRACKVRVSALAAVAAQFVGPTTQPAPPQRSAVEPGGYSQPGQASRAVTFFVPAGAGSVLNFSIPTVTVACAGSSGFYAPFQILKVTIGRNGSFTATASQTGVVNGANAKTTYFVTGRFQGKSAAGAATADGVYRENVVFTDTGQKCTTNDQSWTATRSSPPPKNSVEPGSYTQPGQASRAVTFLVPAGAGSVLNFSIPTVTVACAGSSGFYAPFKILKATIKRDRSFTATASQTGVINGANAKTTYFVTAYFRGPDSAGAATAAGVYREDVVFTDTPNRRCTTNDQFWTATRTG
jgi:hypothetical protein